ncbi:MAG: methyltransferase domain-containing protein, partial [Bacteroidaceae bacterium]|nr:methyltransferase domain-containing protein [Bacteroidaceae bacterium]
MATLKADKDPMGQAISDYFHTGKAKKLRVLSSMFDEDEIPVSTLFRSLEEMNDIERKALDAVQGRILDVGAGSGCHTLELQKRGHSVTAIDISPLSVETMQARGVADARLADFYAPECGGPYHTLLMLM